MEPDSRQQSAPPVAPAPGDTAVRVLLIVNPMAGPGLWAGAHPAAERLRAGGWHVQVAATNHRGHAEELARGAVVDGYDVVIGCGGDGTLNEIVQALVHSQTALGIIPMGTANVLARDMGIPLDPVRAAEVLLAGRSRVVDVGRAGERAFIMMAGVGFDARVIREVEAARGRHPRLLKAPHLTWTAVRRFFTDQGTPMYLSLDGRAVRGRVLMLVAGNIRSYGGVFQIAHAADWDDGILDVVVIYSGRLVTRVASLVDVILRRYTDRRRVAYFRVREARIWTAQPVPVQADGEVVGITPICLTLEPRALRVLLP